MTAAICVPCQLDMKPVLVGARVEEMAGSQPYKLWAGDAYQCPGCGAHVVTRFSLNPIAESWQVDYQKRTTEGTYCRAYQKESDKP